MNTRTMRTIDKVPKPNKKLRHKIASAIFAAVAIAAGGLTLGTPASAQADNCVTGRTSTKYIARIPYRGPHRGHCGEHNTTRKFKAHKCVNGRWVTYYDLLCRTCLRSCGEMKDIGGPCTNNRTRRRIRVPSRMGPLGGGGAAKD
jgi:hypothetical protein